MQQPAGTLCYGSSLLVVQQGSTVRKRLPRGRGNCKLKVPGGDSLREREKRLHTQDQSQVRLTLAGATERPSPGPQPHTYTHTHISTQSPDPPLFQQTPGSSHRQSTQPVLGTQEVGFKAEGTKNSGKLYRDGMGRREGKQKKKVGGSGRHTEAGLWRVPVQKERSSST